MDNPRADKVAIVTEVKDRLEQSQAVMVTEYRGLTVKALDELRRSLRPVGGSYKVYKNTLVRRAADDADIDLSEHLVGPTALAFTEDTPDGAPGDVVAVAKVLRDFAKSNPELVVKGGYFEGQTMDAEGVKALADVEPREVLLSKLAGLMAAPMQQFAGLLQAVPRDFAYGLQALIDEGGAPGAPADAPAPAEASADDTDAASAAEADEAAPAEDAADSTDTTETDTPEAEAASGTETTEED